MCGIFALLLASGEERGRCAGGAFHLQRRGPDSVGVAVFDDALLFQFRLAVVDARGGSLLLQSRDGRVALVVNGEIYDAPALRRDLESRGCDFCTHASDCEVLLQAYIHYGVEFMSRVSFRGMYAFVIYDRRSSTVVAARDMVGIVPLYLCRSSSSPSFSLASELKAFVLDGAPWGDVSLFPPGTWASWNLKELGRGGIGESPSSAGGGPPVFRGTHEAARSSFASPRRVLDFVELRGGLRDAVVSHLQTDERCGFLLSGGLDSSIIAALGAEYYRGSSASPLVSSGAPGARRTSAPISTFSVGLEGTESPDRDAARTMSEFLRSDHEHVSFTVPEGIALLSEVVRAIETFDVTTIRASIPMYILGKRVSQRGFKAVLSGEGADETFAGYMYFHEAPTAGDLHQELVRKVKDLHLYDCARANKSMAAHGVECRVPFLDTPFLEYSMALQPVYKQCRTAHGKARIEKKALRDAFAAVLPPEVACRQKEQFSDGVGYAWIDGLRAHADSAVTDDEMANARSIFPFKTPRTKEAFLYRKLFEANFGSSAVADDDDAQPAEREAARRSRHAVGTVPNAESVACSSESALLWSRSFEREPDPSGRSVTAHVAHVPRADP